MQVENDTTLQANASDETIDASDLVHLNAMRKHAKLGYLKGLTDCITLLEEKYSHATWYSHLALLVEACDLDSIQCALDELGGSSDSTV